MGNNTQRKVLYFQNVETEKDFCHFVVPSKLTIKWYIYHYIHIYHFIYKYSIFAVTEIRTAPNICIQLCKIQSCCRSPLATHYKKLWLDCGLNIPSNFLGYILTFLPNLLSLKNCTKQPSLLCRTFLLFPLTAIDLFTVPRGNRSSQLSKQTAECK